VLTAHDQVLRASFEETFREVLPKIEASDATVH
jgi:hypothetical protein